MKRINFCKITDKTRMIIHIICSFSILLSYPLKAENHPSRGQQSSKIEIKFSEYDNQNSPQHSGHQYGFDDYSNWKFSNHMPNADDYYGKKLGKSEPPWLSVKANDTGYCWLLTEGEIKSNKKIHLETGTNQLTVSPNKTQNACEKLILNTQGNVNTWINAIYLSNIYAKIYVKAYPQKTIKVLSVILEINPAPQAELLITKKSNQDRFECLKQAVIEVEDYLTTMNISQLTLNDNTITITNQTIWSDEMLGCLKNLFLKKFRNQLGSYNFVQFTLAGKLPDRKNKKGKIIPTLGQGENGGSFSYISSNTVNLYPKTFPHELCHNLNLGHCEKKDKEALMRPSPHKEYPHSKKLRYLDWDELQKINTNNLIIQ